MIYVAAFFVLGTIIGGQINHAIYRFALFRKRPISPWTKPHPKASKRVFVDFIPVVGWTTLAREEGIHGSLFWLRPFLIELFWGFAVAWLFVFHCDGTSGLVSKEVEIPYQITTQWSWFSIQLIMFSLLVIATFIDFDEFTIPDQVTIPGVIVAVIFAATFPAVSLPHVNELDMSQPMTFATPLTPAVAWYSQTGLFFSIACLGFWCFALVPKICTFRKGLSNFLPIMLASILQRPRSSQGMIKITPRRMYWGTPVLAGIFVLGSLGMTLFWYMAPDHHKIGLLTSIVGLTFGMTMIWTIRIVGRLALGKEAMGFGDVTLMAMIGAYVGWQACLPILAASAFIALLVSIPMAMVKSGNTLPYGPYLSAGTVVVTLCWNNIWNDWLFDLFNTVGPHVIFMVLVGMILPMFFLLRITRFIKERLIGTD